MQYPPNPYGQDPGQPYNQPTTPTNQYPPYGQPPYPQNTYYQQPPQPSPMASRWYRWTSQNPDAATYRKQWGKSPRGTRFGCGVLVVAVLLCGLCGIISNASSHNNAGISADAHPTATHQAIVQSHNGVTPTPRPTPTATPKPTPVPTPTPVPVQVQPTSPPAPTCNGTVMDGICYNTDPTGGSVVTNTPSGFCGYYSCITSFSSGTGYIVECGNAEWSHSGGHSGACSRDGGVIATLYSH